MAFVVLPLFVESTVGTNVEALFWGQSLGKCVAHGRTEDKEIFRGGHSIKETGAGLIYTVGVDFVKNLHQTGSARAIAYTACFLTPINGLDIVGPDKMKDGLVLVNRGWHAETPLIVVLI